MKNNMENNMENVIINYMKNDRWILMVTKCNIEKKKNDIKFFYYVVL